jgi:hypothetical protein
MHSEDSSDFEQPLSKKPRKVAIPARGGKDDDAEADEYVEEDVDEEEDNMTQDTDVDHVGGGAAGQQQPGGGTAEQVRKTPDGATITVSPPSLST